MNSKEPTQTTKAPAPRDPVSVFLPEDAAGGLKSAGPYVPGRRHDKVPADMADRLVARFKFKIVSADFVPPSKPAATPAQKEV